MYIKAYRRESKLVSYGTHMPGSKQERTHIRINRIYSYLMLNKAINPHVLVIVTCQHASA